MPVRSCPSNKQLSSRQRRIHTIHTPRKAEIQSIRSSLAPEIATKEWIDCAVGVSGEVSARQCLADVFATQAAPGPSGSIRQGHTSLDDRIEKSPCERAFPIEKRDSRGLWIERREMTVLGICQVEVISAQM